MITEGVVLAYYVTQRTHELGVRIALGASVWPALRAARVNPVQALRGE